jgi:hypothetical protein
LQAGDVILELDGLRPGKATLHELRATLIEPRQISCSVRRGDHEHRLSLDLTAKSIPSK